jgi:hypothetical protein
MLTAFLIASMTALAPEAKDDVGVKTAEAACDAVKARVSASRHFPTSIIAFCDTISERDSPKNLYVLALHSKRECDGICSTNMGWFAVQKTTGRVFEWNVAEWKLGSLVKPTP